MSARSCCGRDAEVRHTGSRFTHHASLVTVPSDPSTAMNSPLPTLRDAWRARWPDAGAWSRFVQLSEPRWCLTAAEEKAERLSGSFATIRLVDHAVVISPRQVPEHALADFATEILAHEIGHHVYCPADLTDHTRMLARMSSRCRRCGRARG